MGASVAWHLRRLGIEDVVLLERDVLASGSTSKSAGGFRTQFADELNIRDRAALARRARADGRASSCVSTAISSCSTTRRTSSASGPRSRCSTRSACRPASSRSTRRSRSSRSSIPTACSRRRTASSTVRSTPEDVVQWYARGTDVRQSCAVTGIDVRAGRIVGVETTAGPDRDGDRRLLRRGVVAGGRRDGRRRHPRARRAALDALHAVGRRAAGAAAADVDFSTSFYFHREGPGLAFGGREQTLEELAVPAARRLPVLAELPVQSSWWGYYEVSPDHNAIVGEAAEPTRFLYATGFSGHGFQQAPAVGEHIAELVAGREPTLDLSPFALERFERGRGAAGGVRHLMPRRTLIVNPHASRVTEERIAEVEDRRAAGGDAADGAPRPRDGARAAGGRRRGVGARRRRCRQRGA